jgi:hypothetical protein
MALETRSIVDALRSEMQCRILSGAIPLSATLAGAAQPLTRLRAVIRQKIAERVKYDITDFHRALVTTTWSPRLRRPHGSVIGEGQLSTLVSSR